MPDEIIRDQTELLRVVRRPTIRVLIYTDDPEKVREDGIFGIRELRKQIAAHPLGFADIDLATPVSRNSSASHHADRKINDELNRDPKNPYHEVWFFGIHQANKPKFKLQFPGGGGPRSELEADEVAALETWMSVDGSNGSKGIGVLMSGDHSNPPPDKQPVSGPNKFCPPNLDHRLFFGLGRAIGKNVPRGGLLRKWEGPPTHCSEDSFNTLFPPPDQMDPRPQRLILPRFDLHGNPDPTGRPHELFRGKNGEWIRVLPDHDHEGAVILPDDFPEKIWPSGQGSQPRPKFVAFGTDQRTGRQLNILAAYDGDAAGVGRIVSDSSWHHYFNVNLKFLSADNLDLPEADQIGQFYSNLVLWLAPIAIRRAMANSMFTWLATHPLMLEEISAGPFNIGTIARQLLREVASDCEIHELLVAACPTALRTKYETFDFPDEPGMNELPTVEVILGSVISKYFEVLFESEQDFAVSDTQLATVITEGFIHAFVLNARSGVTFSWHSLTMLSSFQPGFMSPAIINSFKSLESLPLAIEHSETRRSTMRIATEPISFTIRLDKGGEEDFTLELETGECQIFEPLELSICPLRGWLRSDFEEYEVRGTLFYSPLLSALHLEFPFRRVRLIMGGFVHSNGDILTRFIAVEPSSQLSKRVNLPRNMAINPDVGDTGTGTGTATLL